MIFAVHLQFDPHVTVRVMHQTRDQAAVSLANRGQESMMLNSRQLHSY
jgi:hypothetical protein